MQIQEHTIDGSPEGCIYDGNVGPAETSSGVDPWDSRAGGSGADLGTVRGKRGMGGRDPKKNQQEGLIETGGVGGICFDEITDAPWNTGGSSIDPCDVWGGSAVEPPHVGGSAADPGT
jgi:hypothetical protein